MHLKVRGKFGKDHRTHVIGDSQLENLLLTHVPREQGAAKREGIAPAA